MNTNLRKELPLLFLALVPFGYLAYLYPELPATVPLHFNAAGEVDDWGPKSTLWILPILLTGFVYLILLVVPKLDPKGQIKQMGTKYYQLRWLLMLFMAAIAVYVIYAIARQSLTSPIFIQVLTALLFTALGNYMPAVKPNYFVGIRTPWTLENETVWKKTHRLTGKIWVIIGLILLLAAFVTPIAIYNILFAIGIGIMVLVPLAYSYIYYIQITEK